MEALEKTRKETDNSQEIILEIDYELEKELKEELVGINKSAKARAAE